MKKFHRQFLLVFLLSMISMDVWAAKDAHYYLKEASKYYNSKDYHNAEKAFEQVLKMRVSLHQEFYYYYGKTLFQNRRYKEAAKQLDNFTKTVSNDNRFYTDAKKLLTQSQQKMAAQQEKQSKQKKSKAPVKLSAIPEMVKIPTGKFLMGSQHGSPDQLPTHRVTIDQPFAIGKYEVTFDQYDRFAQATKRKKPNDYGWGRGNRPVINVSYYDAVAYAEWLSEKTGRKFRLPTETEWEYVARTGFKSQLGFNDLMGLGDANCDECRYFWESAQTKPVGSFDANKYGLHDLFGNVWEWTCSVYTRRYNGMEKTCIDEKDLEGKTISVRGGGWNSSGPILRSYVRYNNFPTYLSNEVGFRVLEEL
jgi:formylglycine-generating enzyme required for sulfatase activity